jgi:hypothetical protein
LFSESKIREIIKEKINQDEDLGDQVGGSGHLGNVSYEIDSISEPEEVKTDTGDGWKISYVYSLIVVTEFTYYPDNPPREFSYRKTVIIDDMGTIIREFPRKSADVEFKL